MPCGERLDLRDDLAISDCHSDSLCRRRDTQALANAAQMVLHCALGQTERRGDIDLPSARGGPGQYLAFAGGQGSDGIMRGEL